MNYLQKMGLQDCSMIKKVHGCDGFGRVPGPDNRGGPAVSLASSFSLQPYIINCPGPGFILMIPQQMVSDHTDLT